MKWLALYIFTPSLSYLSGLITYSLVLLLSAEESLTGELNFVVYYSMLAFILVCVPLYVLVIRWIDVKFPKFGGWLYPIGCMLVFFIPTLLIGLRFGTILLFSTSALLFHSMFAAVGAVFGLCRWAIEHSPKLAVVLIAAGLIISGTWLSNEKNHSYDAPEKAFLAQDEDLFIIPGYSDFFKSPQRYFFVKENRIGTAYAVRRPFGWKAEPIDWQEAAPPEEYDHLEGDVRHDDQLIYGFVKLKSTTNRQIELAGAQSAIIHPLLPEELERTLRMEDVYIWYSLKDKTVKEGEVQLIDKETGKVVYVLEL